MCIHKGSEKFTKLRIYSYYLTVIQYSQEFKSE